MHYISPWGFVHFDGSGGFVQRRSFWAGWTDFGLMYHKGSNFLVDQQTCQQWRSKKTIVWFQWLDHLIVESWYQSFSILHLQIFQELLQEIPGIKLRRGPHWLKFLQRVELAWQTLQNKDLISSALTGEFKCLCNPHSWRWEYMITKFSMFSNECFILLGSFRFSRLPKHSLGSLLEARMCVDMYVDMWITHFEVCLEPYISLNS